MIDTFSPTSVVVCRTEVYSVGIGGACCVVCLSYGVGSGVVELDSVCNNYVMISIKFVN